MSNLDRVNPVELGGRLREARAAACVSQEKAAAEIGAVRTTMVAIEKGNRRIREEELVKLASLYGCTCSELLHPPALGLDLVPQFRMTYSEGMSDLAADCGKLLQKLATAYLEVERLLSDPLPVRPFPEYAIPKDAIESFAEDLALRIRGDTGLGLDPIPDIFHLVESWGFRVFARPIDAKVSGVFAFHPIIGPAVLLNSNHPVTRAASAVAHEFAHLLTSRTVPEVTWVDESGRKSIAERFAPLFAQAFLMPAPTVREQYARVKDLDGDFTMRGLLYLADWYHVSIEAMARRLEQLKLVRPGTAELLRSRGVANPGGARRQAQITGTIVGPIPRRLAYLLSVAQARGLLSEGEIARKVVIDRLELRRVLDDYSESEPS